MAQGQTLVLPGHSKAFLRDGPDHDTDAGQGHPSPYHWVKNLNGPNDGMAWRGVFLSIVFLRVLLIYLIFGYTMQHAGS